VYDKLLKPQQSFRITLYYISTESLIFHFPVLHQEGVVNGRVCIEVEDWKYVGYYRGETTYSPHNATQ